MAGKKEQIKSSQKSLNKNSNFFTTYLSSNLEFKQIGNIAKREFSGYFFSPVAYIVIAIYLAVSGWFFYSDFFLQNTASVRQFFVFMPWIFTFILPAVTMRLYAEEYSVGSYEMLRTLPLSAVEIVTGKFLGAVAFLAVMYFPTLSYAFFTSMVGNLDWGSTLCGYAGGFLLGSSYLAIGIFASAITKNQIIAFIVSVLFCFVLTSIDSFFLFLPRSLLFIFQYLSASYHFGSLTRGVVDTRDLLYFGVVIFLFLFFTHRVMLDKVKK